MDSLSVELFLSLVYHTIVTSLFFNTSFDLFQQAQINIKFSVFNHIITLDHKVPQYFRSL